MAVGTARPAQTVRLGAFAAALWLTCPPLRAQTQDGVTPPALSRTCEVPAADIASMAPLPRTVEKLRTRGQLRVMAIGSSSTAGVGASSASNTYPAKFEGILEGAFKGLDVVILNRGVSGEQAAITSERLKTQVALERPDLVLWQVGTNDALVRVPVERFQQTVSETIAWLKEHGIDVVLVGLQYTPSVARDEYYASIRASLHRVAMSANVLLVRRFEAMEFLDRVQHGSMLSSDGLHLNDLGYLCMAEHVARAVVISAFLKAALPPPQTPPR